MTQTEDILRRLDWLENEIHGIRQEVMRMQQGMHSDRPFEYGYGTGAPQRGPGPAAYAGVRTGPAAAPAGPAPAGPAGPVNPSGPVDPALATTGPKQGKNNPLNETSAGKAIMGLGAAVLILAALAFFAMAVMPYITDMVKAILMTAFSLAVLITGMCLRRRLKWAMVLEGIGLSALFLSFIAGNIIFDVYSVPVVSVLIIIWIAGSGYFAFRREFFFSIITQAGIVFAMLLLCGQIGTFGDDEKIVSALPLWAAVFAIEAGFLVITSIRRGYREVLVVAIGFALTATAQTGFMYSWTPDGGTLLPVCIGIVSAGIVCAIGIPLYMKSESKAEHALSAYFSLVMFLLASAFIFRETPDAMGIRVAQAAAGMIALITVLSLLYLHIVRSGMEAPHYYVISAIALFIAVCCLNRIDSPEGLLLSYVYAFCIIGAFTAAAVLSEVTPVFTGGYVFTTASCAAVSCVLDVQTGWFVPACIAMCALSCYAMYKIKGKDGTACRVISYALFFVPLLQLNINTIPELTDGMDPVIRDAVCTAVFMLMVAAGYAELKLKFLGDGMIRYIFSGIATVYFLAAGSELDGIMFWVFLLLVIVPQLVKNTKEQLAKARGGISGHAVVMCLKYTVLIMYVLHQYEAAGFIYSVAFLAVAGACVIAGMKLGIKVMRIYGLVVAIIGIIKLLVVDMSYDSLLLRAGAFLLAGLICLGLSFAYNMYEKKAKGSDG